MMEDFNYRNYVGLIIFVLALSSTQSFSSEEKASRPHVVYLASDKIGFWARSLEVAKKVAGDLNIKLTYIPTDHRFLSIEAAKELAASENKPDYILFHYQEDSSNQMLAIMEAAGIKSFVFNTDVPQHEQAFVGKPREKFQSWIGHIHSNDKANGYFLTEKLIDIQQQSTGIGGKEITLGGVCEWNIFVSASQREKGLKQKATEVEYLKLTPMIKKQQNSEQAVLQLLQRYPDISILWTSSDILAMEAISAGVSSNRILGKDLFIGGIDASTEGLQAVRHGDLAVTMGGHFMESGWALVLIHDYHMGLDFENELGSEINIPMLAITQENVDYFTSFFEGKSWMDHDFKQDSKFYNPDLKAYNFSIEKFLN